MVLPYSTSGIEERFLIKVDKKVANVRERPELKKHKMSFDEGCSILLDQRKQAKFQWFTGFK
jgi:hypothetical protein